MAMKWLLFASALFLGLLVELVTGGIVGQPVLFLVRLLYVVFIVGGELTWLQHICGIFLVAGSSFLQGLPVSWVVGSLLVSSALWHFLREFVHRRRFAYSVLSVIFFMLSCLVDGTLYWTPLVVIANIIIVPVMVRVFCKV